MSCIKNAIFLLLLYVIICTSVYAEDDVEDVRYVTDELEITLHRNMSLSSEIITQLKSGTPVRVLKTKRDEGYVLVATKNEKVGWTLESYLINEPAGREQYQTLKKEYDKIKTEFDTQLAQRTEKLTKEVERLKRISKLPLELQEENQRLKETLQQERAEVESIKQENREFKSIHMDRQWLITGAVIALGSLILGLIITKIPWRKRKSWGEI